MSFVLVVDDDQDTAFAFQVLLESEGFEVATARNGAEALDVIAQRKPDIVMTDVRMPAMDGNELCERLAADPATRDLPVIVVTGIADTAPYSALRDKRILRKPATPDQLVEAIHQHGA